MTTAIVTFAFEEVEGCAWPAPDRRALLEAWLAEQAGSVIEVYDQQTREILGHFVIASGSAHAEVAP